MERVRTSPGQRLHGERCSGDPGQTLAPDDRSPGAGQQVDTQHGGPQWAEGDQADRPQPPEDLGECHKNRDTCATGGGVVRVHVGGRGWGLCLVYKCTCTGTLYKCICTNVHVQMYMYKCTCTCTYTLCTYVPPVMYMYIYNIVFL